MDGNSKNIVTTAKDKAKGNPPLADSSLHPRPKGRGFAEQFDKICDKNKKEQYKKIVDFLNNCNLENTINKIDNNTVFSV